MVNSPPISQRERILEMPTQKEASMPKQNVCIDIPGEPFCAWGGHEVEVVLRKSRDVVFDINTGKKDKEYCIETPGQWFYDVRSKKRVQQTKFKDGELCHIWIARNFDGLILLKNNGSIVNVYSPRELDPTVYMEDPKIKPLPLIFSLRDNQKTSQAPKASSPVSPSAPSHSSSHSASGSSSSASTASTGKPTAISGGIASAQHSSQSASSSNSQTSEAMHVVEINLEDAPEAIGEFFKNGGEETAIDTNHQLTRNWIFTQITAALATKNDSAEWREGLSGVKFVITTVKHPHGVVKRYVVFKGNRKTFDIFKKSKYGIGKEKIFCVSLGAGSVEGAVKASINAGKEAFKKAGLLAVLFTITLDSAEWIKDWGDVDPKTGKPKRSVMDLFAKIGSDLAKAFLSSVIGTLISSAIVSFFAVAYSVTLPVTLVVVGTFLVIVGVGYGLDWIDNHLHLTETIGKWLNEAAEYLEKAFSSDYVQYQLTYNSANSAGA